MDVIIRGKHCFLCFHSAAAAIPNNSRSQANSNKQNVAKTSKSMMITTTTTQQQILLSTTNNTTSSSSSPLTNLCKHLKLDLGKMIKDVVKGPSVQMPASELNKTGGKLLMQATMCGTCANVTQKFSDLYEEMEKIKRMMGGCLDEICRGICGGEDDLKLKEGYVQAMMMEENINVLLLSGFFDELRKQIGEQCSSTTQFTDCVPIEEEEEEEEENNLIPVSNIITPTTIPQEEEEEETQNRPPPSSTSSNNNALIMQSNVKEEPNDEDITTSVLGDDDEPSSSVVAIEKPDQLIESAAVPLIIRKSPSSPKTIITRPSINNNNNLPQSNVRRISNHFKEISKSICSSSTSSSSINEPCNTVQTSTTAKGMINKEAYYLPVNNRTKRGRSPKNKKSDSSIKTRLRNQPTIKKKSRPNKNPLLSSSSRRAIFNRENGKWQCTFPSCNNVEYGSSGGFQYHYKTVHCKFKCEVVSCFYSFHTKGEADVHLRRFHGDI